MNKKLMTVLSCIPVLNSAGKIDKNTSEPIHTMIYVVDELKEVFLSREALTELKMNLDGHLFFSSSHILGRTSSCC